MARSITFESQTYGKDPAKLLEDEQNRQQRESRRVGEVLGPRWSSAREAAERLFDLPERPQSEA
jgi:hypothetical protein